MGKRRENRRSNRRMDQRAANGNVITLSDHTNVPLRTRKKKVEILPRNYNQEQYMFAIEDNTITFGVGPAGTGKTLLATTMAIKELRAGNIERIIITRPAVGTQGEEHGFLPGTLIEKMAPWTRPIFDVFEEYYTPQQIEKMIEDGVLEVAPLAYMRGRSFKDAWILLDEAQNCTPEQVKMALTRIGENAKMIVTGDLNQHDRVAEVNGLQDFIERYKKSGSDDISIIEFEKGDIERSPIVASVLGLYGE